MSADIEQGWDWFTDEAVTYGWTADEDIEISVTNTWYLDSREPEGTTIDARNSRPHLPQRPDGNAPEEQEEDDDCW